VNLPSNMQATLINKICIRVEQRWFLTLLVLHTPPHDNCELHAVVSHRHAMLGQGVGYVSHHTKGDPVLVVTFTIEPILQMACETSYVAERTTFVR
jgi:hypothetical protein